jgi:hypothetical protein
MAILVLLGTLVLAAVFVRGSLSSMRTAGAKARRAWRRAR